MATLRQRDWRDAACGAADDRVGERLRAPDGLPSGLVPSSRSPSAPSFRAARVGTTVDVDFQPAGQPLELVGL